MEVIPKFKESFIHLKKIIMKNSIVLFFATVVMIVNLNAQNKRDGGGQSAVASYQIGDKVEDFSLKNIDGEKVSLSNYDDTNGYIVVFTSNVCPFAIASEDKLVQIHNEMAPKGYPVVAINSNKVPDGGESMADMKERAREKNFPFDYLKDNASVYQKFGATKTPHVFLVDKEMVLRYTGSIDDNPRSPEEVEEEYLTDAINDLIYGRTPDPAVTKSIGCPIKNGNRGGGKGEKGGRRRKGPPNAEAIMERMDMDKDGKISKSEAKGPLADRFDEMDANKDGSVTADELKKKH